MKDHFNGRMEERGPPKVVMGDEQAHRGVEYQDWLGNGNKEGSDGDPSKIHGVKRRSALYDLPYWKVRTYIYNPIFKYVHNKPWELFNWSIKYLLNAKPHFVVDVHMVCVPAFHGIGF